MAHDSKHHASLCILGNHDPKLGMTMPVHISSSYYYLDEGPQPYPRYFNTPNQNSVAKKIATLEHADEGMIFSSGMAAISTCLMSLISPGDHVLLLQGLYGGSHSFLRQELEKWNIEYDFVPPEVEQFGSRVKDNTVLAFIETPTNPCLGILDLEAMGAFAKEANITTVIDNTFATPINQNPIDFGIDVVVHSGTKYLGGHSDLSCGAVVGSTSVMERVRKQALMYGGNLGELPCYLLDRSIKTLDVRVQRQNENAMKVAEFLSNHQRVTKVLYPGLPTHPGHEVAAKQMRGFGGMISFEVDDSLEVREFLTRLKFITPAMSLGGVESTVTVPVYTSHAKMTVEEREACGVTPGMIRVSVGAEHSDDLIADFAQALDG
jgi:cystathionine beta-lyase